MIQDAFAKGLVAWVLVVVGFRKAELKCCFCKLET